MPGAGDGGEKKKTGPPCSHKLSSLRVHGGFTGVRQYRKITVQGKGNTGK